MQSSRAKLTTNLTVSGCAALVVYCIAAQAGAQPAPTPELAPTEAPPPATADVPPPAAPVIVLVAPPTVEPSPGAMDATPPAAEISDTPPPPTAAAPEPEPVPLKVSSFMHLTNRVQNFKKPENLDRFSQDNTLYLIASGDVTKQVGYQVALVGAYGPISPTSGSINGSVSLLDVIGKLQLHDGFQVWGGRMLVPSDRSNFSGFWFQAPWYYPGGYYNAIAADNHYFGAPVGPRQGPSGRNDGATVWGEFGGGVFKYYVGAYDVFSANNTPLISGRLNLALINPEPGYYHSSTYYGTKDILAIGLSAQYQKSKGDAKDYSELSADILFEKNTGSGTIDLEGTFYKYYASSIDFNYYLVASYLTPDKVGPGHFQPLVRLQQAKPVGADMWTIFEAQLGYVINQDAARLALGYQWQKAGEVKSNALYLGLQLMK